MDHHARSQAARRIQKAFREFRRHFPGGGKLHSRSSTEPIFYQEDSRLVETLAEAFAELILTYAQMEPEDRIEELRALKRSLPPPKRSFVRAAAGKKGGMTFSGGRVLARWALEAFAVAAERLGEEDRWLLADMQPWEFDVLLNRFQRDEVVEAVNRLRGGKPTRILRTVAEPRPKGKPGYPPQRHVVAVDEDAAFGDSLRIVGAPGDRFRLRRDIVRFLGHALGGFRNYAWRLNPRRRRRKAGRPQRWVMHANYGLNSKALYRILRAMRAWAGRVEPRRGWRLLFPRPIETDMPQRLGPAVKALLRTLRAGTGSRVPRAYSEISSSRSASRSAEGRAVDGRGSPKERIAVGSFTSEDHYGGFVARLRGGSRLHVDVFDPHADNTLPEETRERFEAAVRRANPEMEVVTRLVHVPRALRLQYRNEGSCGPSSIALMLSLCRLLAGGAPPPPSDLLFVRAFRSVTDEDVVLAAQLTHSAVV
jgi:hypothetical protein